MRRKPTHWRWSWSAVLRVSFAACNHDSEHFQAPILDATADAGSRSSDAWISVINLPDAYGPDAASPDTAIAMDVYEGIGERPDAVPHTLPDSRPDLMPDSRPDLMPDIMPDANRAPVLAEECAPADAIEFPDVPDVDGVRTAEGVLGCVDALDLSCGEGRAERVLRFTPEHDGYAVVWTNELVSPGAIIAAQRVCGDAATKIGCGVFGGFGVFDDRLDRLVIPDLRANVPIYIVHEVAGPFGAPYRVHLRLTGEPEPPQILDGVAAWCRPVGHRGFGRCNLRVPGADLNGDVTAIEITPTIPGYAPT